MSHCRHILLFTIRVVEMFQHKCQFRGFHSINTFSINKSVNNMSISNISSSCRSILLLFDRWNTTGMQHSSTKTYLFIQQLLYNLKKNPWWWSKKSNGSNTYSRMRSRSKTILHYVYAGKQGGDGGGGGRGFLGEEKSECRLLFIAINFSQFPIYTFFHHASLYEWMNEWMNVYVLV